MSNRARARRRPGAATGRPFPTVPVVIAAAAVVLLGVVLAVVRGGDDRDASGVPAFGPVAVEGPGLPTFQPTEDDAAAGRVAPLVEGRTPDGDAVSIGGGEGDGPSLVVFLAHWCPHCRAEVPVLVEMDEDGALEGVRLVAVLTGTNADAPNYPPVAWLEREAWPGEVLLDDDEHSAAGAFGLAGYPFMVVLDGEGRVVARTSGQQSPEVVAALLEAAGAP